MASCITAIFFQLMQVEAPDILADPFEKSTLQVWYAWEKLTKLKKKRALVILYENHKNRYERKMKHVNRLKTKIVRYQSIDEAKDGAGCTREFTRYRLMLDAKPFNGDLEALLQCNFDADQNNVPEEEREQIRKDLRAQFQGFYK